jgi:nicotinamidase-related amidase
MKKALLLIDIQNDYFNGGRNQLVNAEKAAETAKQALDFFRREHLPVFHVQHISLQEGATFFLPNSDGCEINARVLPERNETVVIKHTPDSFFQTDLNEQLAALGIEQLFICGMMSHMCVDTSVRAAKRLGYNVILIADACATRDLEWNDEIIPAETVHNVFMASLKGTFAEVICWNDITNRF